MKRDIRGGGRQGNNAFKTGFKKILSTEIITYSLSVSGFVRKKVPISHDNKGMDV